MRWSAPFWTAARRWTRRAVKPQPREIYRGGTLFDDDGDLIALAESQNGRLEQSVAPYRPGDILYIPQAWKCVGIFGELGYEAEFRDGQRVKFKFESRERAKKWAKYRDKPACQWQSPYFMPREAARLFLRVTDVRVERLQEITEEQAIKEGVYCSREDYGIAIYTFSDIWDSTIKSADRALYGWAANPRVWVIEFERYKNRRRCDDGISEKDLFMGS